MAMIVNQPDNVPNKMSQTQIEKLIKTHRPLVEEIRHTQNRAGTMAAVIATIMGIGLPLIAQPQTKQYFHIIPFFFLLCSFLLFYWTYIRATWLGTPKYKKKSVFLTVISGTLVLRTDEPLKDVLSKSLILARALSQWGHAFFLTFIFGELAAVYLSPSKPTSKSLQLLCGLLLAILIRVTAMSTTGMTNPSGKQINTIA
jgi:hypothetical protein